MRNIGSESYGPPQHHTHPSVNFTFNIRHIEWGESVWSKQGFKQKINISMEMAKYLKPKAKLAVLSVFSMQKASVCVCMWVCAFVGFSRLHTSLFSCINFTFAWKKIGLACLDPATERKPSGSCCSCRYMLYSGLASNIHTRTPLKNRQRF